MRQHGVVASTCIHGFAPGTCLICQTLQAGTTTATRVAGAGEDRKLARRTERGRLARSEPPARASTPLRPDAIVGPPGSHRSHLGLRLIGFVVVAIAVLLAVSLVIGFVLSVLRILELVAVAALAGWIGWSLGVHHGRRTRA
jgi:Flp pilus assembly protein TadB